MFLNNVAAAYGTLFVGVDNVFRAINTNAVSAQPHANNIVVLLIVHDVEANGTIEMCSIMPTN